MTQSPSTASYSLEVMIAATPTRVWQALTTEASAWWPKDFHTSTRAERFVIEPVLGGRVFEDFGGGDGLMWYTVIGVEVEKELVMAGHLLPPFGGPAVTALRLTLSQQSDSTQLKIQDDRFGLLGGESPVDGWRMVFDDGLRLYIESGK